MEQSVSLKKKWTNQKVAELKQTNKQTKLSVKIRKNPANQFVESLICKHCSIALFFLH